MLAAGADVVLLGPPCPRHARIRALLGRGAATWAGDALADPGKMSEALRGCDSLVHLAYRPPPDGGALATLRFELDRNVALTAALVDAAATAGVGSIAFASSAQVYGRGGLNREDDPVQPTSSYAAAKLIQEQLVRAWETETGRPAAVLRLTTVYGPGEPTRRAIPRFIDAVLNGRPPRVAGQGVHSFSPVYVDDVADAFGAAVGLNARGTFNVGGEPRMIREVAQLVIKLCGISLNVEEDHFAQVRQVPGCDVSVAVAVLGFRVTPLEYGLRKEIDWFRARQQATAQDTGQALDPASVLVCPRDLGRTP